MVYEQVKFLIQVLRFMTQVPLYFSFSHIPGTKIVSSVCVTIIYYMISLHIYTHTYMDLALLD